MEALWFSLLKPMTSRIGIGRIAATVAVIVLVAVAAGVGVTLGSRSSATNSTRTTTSTSETSSTSSTTTSSSAVSTTSSNVTSSTTTSSSIVPVGCVFSPPGPLIITGKPTTSFASFNGCLTPGATGVYLIGVTDPNGGLLKGAVRTQYASQLTFAGALVGNLTAAGNGATAASGNNTTILSLPQLLLFGSKGYSITVVNQSGQNDTVSINFSFEDSSILAAG
jgi:hypothetical protein